MTHDLEQAYPLAWPVAWLRTAPSKRQVARFSTSNVRYREMGTGQTARFLVRTDLTVAVAIERLHTELDRLGARHPIISTNMPLRLDGLPRSGMRAPEDPGAAVYFTLSSERIVFACDRWTTVADNLAAIAAHIDAIRAVERYGVGKIEQAFRGYRALPAPPDLGWRDVLGQCSTRGDAEAAFRERAKRAHPDCPDGSTAQMAALNAAITAARVELGA